ncbi:AAA family ATPase [Solitalea lacus]|uniref:AAA family ATPase n=1 Tax=Solitalea lacus TaxID=2911172 RepID=UPI001EDA8B91|nr:ATP-binding protein [Solitalea lacus]UKJ06674.1 ATP-binding protein [Solitalea lacus]
MIVIVFGLPGSGKSYFASRLAEMINADYINSDRLRMEMYAVRTYSEEEKLSVYDKMLEKVRHSNVDNRNTIVDGTFYKKDIRKKFTDELRAYGTIFFIEVRAEKSIIRERLKNPRSYSEADFNTYKKIKTQWEPMEDDHLVLESTNDNIEEMLLQAVNHLNYGERRNK